jgi:integrase
MGDLPLQDVEQTTVYGFMDKQLEARHDVSARVLKDNNWSLRKFFKFCIERGYVKINPLADIDVGRRGMPGQTHLNYTKDELHTIFSHNWKPQERLLLSILITTGMRLSEAANLSWERFSEDHDGIQGMRCFSLLNTSDEIVAVKNKGSMRIIPLHPDLVLPPKVTGRLFDYKLNEDGLSSHDAGRAINPTLQKLVPHPQKMAHSFRGTLKELLRDAGVSKEISDFYTGHSSGDVAGTSYGGVGVDTRYNEISKVRHPWLKYKSNLG